MGVRKENFPVRLEKLGGGVGTTEISHLLNNEEFYGAGRMFSRVVLKPGCSIGWHEHKNEVEYYYILSDHGTFTNPNQTVSEVGPGDVCTMLPNQSHAIANTGDEPLEFIALILFVK